MYEYDDKNGALVVEFFFYLIQWKRIIPFVPLRLICQKISYFHLSSNDNDNQLFYSDFGMVRLNASCYCMKIR